MKASIRMAAIVAAFAAMSVPAFAITWGHPDLNAHPDVVNLLFAIGHTAGFLTFRPKSAEGQAAIKAMAVVFSEDGTRFSYDGFYTGFGLSVSLYMLFAAFLAWQLGALAKRDPAAVGPLAIAFCAMQVAQLIVCLVYFFTAPIIFESVIALALALAAWRVRVAARQSPL